MVVRGLRFIATSLNSVMVMMLVLAMGMRGRVRLGRLASLLPSGRLHRSGCGCENGLLLAAAGGWETTIENAAADATGRLEIGAVLLESLGEMGAASRGWMAAILVM